MRRAGEKDAEAHDASRELEPDGDINLERYPPSSLISAKDTPHLEQQRATASHQHPFINTCNEDFTPGADDTTGGGNYGCAGGTALIRNQDECERAASSAGAAINRQIFKLAPMNQSEHPPGCFQWPCMTPSGSVNICFFYNPDPVSGTGSHTGVPMCERRLYMTGVANTYGGDFTGTNANGDPNSGCAEPYAVITHETDCLAADGCFGLKLGLPDIVGLGNGVSANVSMAKTAPVGCFIKKNLAPPNNGTADRDRVQFNRLWTAINDDITIPDFQPVGVPICKIKSTYHTPVGNGAFTKAAVQPTQVVAGNAVGALESLFR